MDTERKLKHSQQYSQNCAKCDKTPGFVSSNSFTSLVLNKNNKETIYLAKNIYLVKLSKINFLFD